MKAKCIYKDKAGNKVYKRYIKSRDVIQLSVKNKQGKLVNPTGTKQLIKKAMRNVK